MKINFKKNGGGYISGCSISFGSQEMRNLHLVDEEGNLKQIVSAKNKGEDTIIIEVKKN